MANTEAIPNALDYEHKAARVVTVLELTLETACAWANECFHVPLAGELGAG